MNVTSGAAVGVLCCAVLCCAAHRTRKPCTPWRAPLASISCANTTAQVACTAPLVILPGCSKGWAQAYWACASILGMCRHTAKKRAATHVHACTTSTIAATAAPAFAPHQYLWLSVVGLCSTKWPASLAAAPLPSVTPSATFSAPGGALPGTHVAVVCISTALLLRQQLRPDSGQGRGGRLSATAWRDDTHVKVHACEGTRMCTCVCVRTYMHVWMDMHHHA